MSTVIYSQEVKDKAIEILTQKELEGFKHGETKIFLNSVAAELNLSFPTVNNLYYNKVRGKAKAKTETETDAKVDSTSTTSNAVTSKAVADDNLARLYNINGIDVRVVKDRENEDSDEEYFVAKEIFKSLNLERSHPVIKSGIKKEHKHYISVKSAHGYVRVMCLKQDGVESFIQYIMNEKNISNDIKPKAQKFLDIITGNTTEVITNATNNAINTKNMTNATNNSINAKQEAIVVEETSKGANASVNPLEDKKKSPAMEVEAKVEDNSKKEIIESKESVQATEVSKNKMTNNMNKSSMNSTKSESNRPKYIYGDLVKCVVKAILPYGIITETLDKHQMQGLIHITEIKDAYVQDIHAITSVNAIVEAKVIKFEESKERLTLSTMAITGAYNHGHVSLYEYEKAKEATSDENEVFNSAVESMTDEEIQKHSGETGSSDSNYVLEDKPANTAIAEQLHKLKVKEKLTLNPAPIKEEKVVEKSEPTQKEDYNYVVGESKTVSSTQKPLNKGAKKMNLHQVPTNPNPLDKIELTQSRELDKIMAKLQDKVGAISPQAREMLAQMLEEKGIVDFTLAMAQVLPDFQPDLGVILLSEIEKKANECL
ncbi:S1 RNA-binding domain-containing protein [Priestia filamentosa]|uniref:S1 RNA-binding domain-containing protein n=1 Tax=Priestia filamentosa TaxID=1402861 RepID=UPI000690DD46